MDLDARKFKLKDLNNNEFNLRGNFGDTPFYHKPTGLGWNIKATTVQNPYTAIVSAIDNDYKDIAGEFISLSYEEERQLDEFIQKGQIKENIIANPDNALRLYYQTTNDLEEYIQIFIYTYDRGEKDPDGKVTIKFKAKKLSNKKRDLIVNITNEIGGEKEGTFPLPTNLPNTPLIQFSNQYTQKLNITINNKGTLTTPAKIIINGKIKNPTWTNKTTSTSGSYNLTADNGTFTVDATYPESITLDGKDQTNSQSRDKENFLFLTTGKNQIEITPFGDDGAITDSCQVSIIYTEERL